MSQKHTYSPEVAKLLDFVEEKIVAGLKHGYFDFGVECATQEKKLREVVVKAGETFKFNVPVDKLPR